MKHFLNDFLKHFGLELSEEALRESLGEIPGEISSRWLGIIGGGISHSCLEEFLVNP